MWLARTSASQSSITRTCSARAPPPRLGGDELDQLRPLLRLGGDPMTVPPGGVARPRRCPATTPDVRPATRGSSIPPSLEEIVAVMREAGDDRHGFRLRALIIVLWPGGLRIQEALELGERDLDPRRGSLLVRNGKGGRPARSEWRAGAGSSLDRGWSPESSSRSGRCSASSTARPAGGPGPVPTRASNLAGSPAERVSGPASRRTSCATPTPWSSRARACR
jgi:hypothetical protein